MDPLQPNTALLPPALRALALGLLIEAVVPLLNKSREGSAKLDRVAEVFHRITESTVKVKTLVDEVNCGSREQTSGIDQVAKAIRRCVRSRRR